MKRTLLLVGMALVCVLATGLAARDSRPATSHAGISTYDAHLQYYEEIRPALIGAADEVRALCNGERAESGGGGQ